MHVRIRTGLRREPEQRWEIYEIPAVRNVGELLDALVEKGLENYRKKASGDSIFPYLTENDLRQQAATGKVAFNAIYQEGNVDVTPAKQTARQSFEDGLIGVFVNGQQAHSLDEFLELEDEAELVFLKLTMLTGNFFD